MKNKNLCAVLAVLVIAGSVVQARVQRHSSVIVDDGFSSVSPLDGYAGQLTGSNESDAVDVSEEESDISILF